MQIAINQKSGKRTEIEWSDRLANYLKKRREAWKGSEL
jgi:hypothetical protein